MNFRTLLRNFSQSDAPILTLLGLAFLLCVVGIGYGLPLWLVGDEPPFVLGTLQMINLKTLLPILHPQAFQSVLYFPPYLCYIYLLPFIVVLGVQYILWHGIVPFASAVLSDLTPYFLIARIFTILLGTASVYLVYKISPSLFSSRKAALVSAFLLATSVTHIGLSITARHWMPTSFIFLLVLYVMTRENIAERTRYFTALIIAGVGVGVDTTAILSLVPAFFWYVTHSHTPLSSLLRDRLMQIGIALFIALVILPNFLYQGGTGFISWLSLFDAKSFFAFIASLISVLSYTLLSEPVLTGLFVVGVCFLMWEHRATAIWALGFFISYITIFYAIFYLQPRFFLPLIPLYALIGGYAFMRMQKINTFISIVLWMLLLIPLAGSIRLSALAYHGDTRTITMSWALANLKQSDKVLVYGELMRLPVNQSSVAELRTIQLSAVRKTDEAGAVLNPTDIPHALNLSTVTDEKFLGNLATYASHHDYNYLIYEPAYSSSATTTAEFNKLISHATLIKEWDGFGDSFSIAGSQFTGALPLLFSPKSLGPTMLVYKLTP